MNAEEARAELTRLKSPRFLMRFGTLCGITLTFAVLGFSFVEPYLDVILTLSIWPMFIVGGYLIIIIRRLDKIESILQDSEEKTT